MIETSTDRLGNRFLLFSILGLATLVIGFGCQGNEAESEKPTSQPKENAAPLKVLVVDAEQFGQNVERLWNAQSDRQIVVTTATGDDFREQLEQTSDIDVLIYPSKYFGDLAASERLLKINPRLLEDDEFAQADLMPLERGRLVRWGADTYAVSLGHRPWSLLYRADLLESAGIEPPKTWVEYAEACRKLSAAPDGPLVSAADWQPTVEPLSGVWAGHLLLARAASYASHRGDYTGLVDLQRGELSVTNAPFERAMTETIEWVTPRSLEATPDDAWQSLLQGHCAMAIGWPGQSGDESLGELPDGVAIRAVPLPGSRRVFIASQSEWRDRETDEPWAVPYVGAVGCLISISEESRRSGSAWGFVNWLSQKQNQQQLCPEAPLAFPSRYSLLGANDRWLSPDTTPELAQDLSTIVRGDQEKFVVLQAPRFRGGQVLISGLADAVRATHQGQSAAESLNAAQATWQGAVSKSSGDEFVQEVEQSLGL